MSRYLFFCSLIALSACSGGDRFEEAAFQYRIDSVVNARLDSVQTHLQQRNDSLILEAARRRADSLRHVPPPATSPPPVSDPPPSIPAPQP